MDPELLTTEPPQPGRRRRSARVSRRYVATGALVAGGVAIGAVFSPVGLAGAQSDSANTADSSDTGSADAGDGDDGASNDRSGRHGGFPGRHLFGLRQSFDDLAGTLGLSSEELMTELRDGNSLAEVAEAQGVDVEEVTSQLLGDLDARLDEAVDDGRLDAEKADEIRALADERIDDLVEGELGAVPEDRPGHRPGFGLGLRLGELAGSLGLTVEDIRSGLAEGKTPVEIAAEAGVSEEELVSAIVAAADEHLDEAVEAGRLDADEAAELRADLEERVSELVNTAPGDLGSILGFGRGGRHGGAWGGPGEPGGWGGPGGRHHDGSSDGSSDDGSADDEGEIEGSSLSF